MDTGPPSPPLTNIPNVIEQEEVYVNIPVNKGKPPPFSALTGLYEKLTHENKPELRKKLLANWFRVRLRVNVYLTID